MQPGRHPDCKRKTSGLRNWKGLRVCAYGFNAADYLDTLTIYKDRAAYPHKLANAIEHYGLAGKVVNSYRAIDDVKALLEVTKAMGAERGDLRDYVNIFGYNPKYGISGRHLKKVSYLQQGFRNEIAPPGQTLPALAGKGRKRGGES